MQVRTDVDAIAEFATDEGGAFHAAGVEAVASLYALERRTAGRAAGATLAAMRPSDDIFSDWMSCDWTAWSWR